MTHPDIVQRLRDYRSFDEWSDAGCQHSICDEAATEITTLRQQLVKAREALALMSPNWHPGDFA